MFIQTEETPNPATLKFNPGEVVMAKGTADFPNAEDATKSPLATELFKIDGVTGVFFGTDFISVTKASDIDWQVLKPAILAVIMEHFTRGLPILADNDAGTSGAGSHGSSEENSEIIEQITDLLDDRIRPAVAQDGGDILFVRFEDGVVYLKMQGACSGCPSSTATLKMGIENMLRHYVPEVEAVEAVA